ncbi:MAG TPA: helix-turn-helix domain-containing protein [Acidimicrobiia bacterium]|nr:helix-turn-helix domain-containing protein [Acidimicrobiia bacterium]
MINGMAEPLLTLQEAADYLRLTPSALYSQRYKGEEPGTLGIRVGKKILYRPADINRFLDERLTESRSNPNSQE